MSNRCYSCDNLVKDQEVKANPEEWSVFNNKPICKRCKHKIQDEEDQYRLIDIPDEDESNAYLEDESDSDFCPWTGDFE